MLAARFPFDPDAPAEFPATINLAEAILGGPLKAAKGGTAGKPITTNVRFIDRPLPGRNVIAILPGSDPRLSGEYVAIGAHNDHIPPADTAVDRDSLKVFNQFARPQGADGEPKSLSNQDWQEVNAAIDSLHRLHGGPRRDSIVAELNMDMVGRGQPGDVTGVTTAGALIHGATNYLQVIGSRRLSTELGDLVEQVNADAHLGFSFDCALDADGHPQNIYCRSDHAEYARYGIPIAFFTTGGHADYHQVTDEPQYIRYEHVVLVDQLVFDLALKVAGLDHRLVVDKAKPADPHGACRQ